MGLAAPITADLPQADLRRVAHVLLGWYFRHPDQCKLAEFALRHVQSRLRGWVAGLPDGLPDGLAADMQWQGWGCLIEWIYGFCEGEEFWVVTRLEASPCAPTTDRVQLLGLLARMPGTTRYQRLPGSAERTINRRASKPVAASGQSLCLRVTAGLRPCRFVQAAPPWLPAAYLAAKIPKARSLHAAIEPRPPADLGKELEMKLAALTANFPLANTSVPRFTAPGIRLSASMVGSLRFTPTLVALPLPSRITFERLPGRSHRRGRFQLNPRHALGRDPGGTVTPLG